MLIETNFKYLKKEALWVIVDPLINPDNDENMNYYDIAFLDKLRQDLDGISNKVVYSESTLPIHEYFKYLPHYKTIDQLVLDSSETKNYVFCGLHYGMCVHKAIKDCKNRVDITNNFFVKRDLCCPMPFDDIRQHDLNLKRHLKVRII